MKHKVLKGLSAVFVPIGLMFTVTNFVIGNLAGGLLMGALTVVNFHFGYLADEPESPDDQPPLDEAV